jgi:pilus assembly protein TadC
MTAPSVAPVLAAVAAVASVGAVALRTRPVLAGLAVRTTAGRRTWLDRIGAASPVRAAVDEARLRAVLPAVGAPISLDRLAGGAAIGGLALAAACVVAGGVAVAAAPLLAAAALRTPAFAAGRAARRRNRAIDRDVPLLLDVLSLASFAGLAPAAALGRAVSAIDGPLAEVLSAALDDIDLGARWRGRLARLAQDVPVADLRRVVAVLVRTESIGAATAEPIAILADEVRAVRRATASERARKAPVQMLFPLVFLILPAFLLLTVVPVLVATLGSIR